MLGVGVGVGVGVALGAGVAEEVTVAVPSPVTSGAAVWGCVSGVADGTISARAGDTPCTRATRTMQSSRPAVSAVSVVTLDRWKDIGLYRFYAYR